MTFKTDLPVMMPVKPHEPEPFLRLKLWHVVPIALLCIVGTTLAFAADGDAKQSPLAVLMNWAPLLLRGFIFNLVISVSAMALGTAVGALLGLGQISPNRIMSGGSWFVTQFFRNAPWLVLLFFAMFLLPFELSILGLKIPFPDWFKAILGLSLPVMANVSEIVRGAVKSLPSGQWEAAESLAYTRRQTLWLIILPQCVKRMLPPWMNLYSILTMATVLASIVGVSEVMTLTGRALSAEGGRPELLAPFYGFVLLLFFVYCYPIARYTVRLEKKFAVIN
ncbi:amino acid ABC transporter membrane protein 2 (PAAT family) [Litoreibacter meonggei]|uniref:Amino acid ABC transporter membrane protein 2 (PAAT family) n=1 Tax=Litoreibacter meonggei TaxID=1049199 RepID=A0A497X430_9RHOB|nr:amino acid ABC transporter permease [Litoreibacter meonggei]RLJ59244.1 amino acid ABC transporter membrane protein 2 (PAAT family) [Litoreibacter meonggei]